MRKRNPHCLDAALSQSGGRVNQASSVSILAQRDRDLGAAQNDAPAAWRDERIGNRMEDPGGAVDHVLLDEPYRVHDRVLIGR